MWYVRAAKPLGLVGLSGRQVEMDTAARLRVYSLAYGDGHRDACTLPTRGL